MKKIFLSILVSFAFFSAGLLAQSDSSKSTIEEKVEVKKVEKSEDQIVPSFKKSKEKKDVFIDRDGDGMCDNRVEGMSFEKMRKRKQKGEGNGKHGGKK